jgi:hypothetical protein
MRQRLDILSIAATLLIAPTLASSGQSASPPAATPAVAPLVWRTDRVNGTSPLYEVVDESDGGHALTLRRMAEAGPSSGDYGTATTTAPAEGMRGQRVTVRAQLRTRDVAGGSIWLRVEGAGTTLLLENNMQHALVGTNEWTEQTATLDLPANAERISYGLLLVGAGEISARGITVTVAAPTGAAMTGIGPAGGR